jgi:alkylhydroperoxidase/carboxymuconolactone decarboxylase family protein YurZ
MSEAVNRVRAEVAERALRGSGVTSPDARRAAFDNRGVDERARSLIDKVARQAWTVTRADVEAATAAGVSEDEIFELTVCAALGQATRQLDAALAVLDAAAGTSGHRENPQVRHQGAR